MYFIIIEWIFFLIITLSFYFFYLLFVCLYMWERFRWSPKYYERKTTFTNAHVFLIYYTEINTPSLLSPVVVVLCCCCTSRLAGFRIDRPEGNVGPSMVRSWEFESSTGKTSKQAQHYAICVLLLWIIDKLLSNKFDIKTKNFLRLEGPCIFKIFSNNPNPYC